ncbi:hypothetical protein GCM10011610_15480 [Nocardia rhizosphaerihabitans]|uniref:Uncharacterized protein n=1 Tax=Nocardia rhizosphaerihabitans TaxID=1691570 RepID=A0ABQ2K7C9_9NOCA|nr:hypothetical protein GCM10011610_15480 [Nocardia rhizosphaerihabitans]
MAEAMNRGVPPTELNARTGELTPPGITEAARSKSWAETGTDDLVACGEELTDSSLSARLGAPDDRVEHSDPDRSDPPTTRPTRRPPGADDFDLGTLACGYAAGCSGTERWELSS